MNSLRIGKASCLVFALLVGCNSVLGIEEATLDPGSASSSKKPQVPPKLNCDEPKVDCKTCRDNCEIQSCLEDNTCRDALFDYRSCLGSTCFDEEAPGCMAAFETAVPDLAGPFLTCIRGCAEDCDDSPLVSTCELYCACLSDNCPQDFEELQNCVQTCKDDNDLTVYGCRLVHCQYAPEFGPVHCEHAMGEGLCEKGSAAPTNDCEDKRISTWTCERNDECCSDSCVNNFCK
jgi:hypothetical protein